MSKSINPTIRRPVISRRRLLKFAGAGFAVSLLGPLGLTVVAEGSQLLDSTLEQFMQISLFLTGRKKLNQKIGQRLYQLLAANPDFSARLLQLQNLPQRQTESWSAVEQKTATDILSAWYLGKVGEGATAQLISYEKALMFDATAGITGIRSYCSGRPGYWAQKPITAA